MTSSFISLDAVMNVVEDMGLKGFTSRMVETGFAAFKVKREVIGRDVYFNRQQAHFALEQLKKAHLKASEALAGLSPVEARHETRITLMEANLQILTGMVERQQAQIDALVESQIQHERRLRGDAK